MQDDSADSVAGIIEIPLNPLNSIKHLSHTLRQSRQQTIRLGCVCAVCVGCVWGVCAGSEWRAALESVRQKLLHGGNLRLKLLKVANDKSYNCITCVCICTGPGLLVCVALTHTLNQSATHSPLHKEKIIHV